MDEVQIQKILDEVRREQHISPYEKDETIIGYIRDGEFDINDFSGAKIIYEKDLKAKSLLKNYIMYARFGRLSEFKQLYMGEYANLQATYYKPTNV